MCRLFETIAIHDGKPQNLPWHQQRLEASSIAVFGKASTICIADELIVPAEASSGFYRCRMDYDQTVSGINFRPSDPVQIRSLRLVNMNDLEYSHKFADRSQIEQAFARRGRCDDVLILKNGLLTDTSFANIVLWDGSRWLTPAEPLLPGTCRARLLAGGKIHEASIRVNDLGSFSKLRLINALRGFEDAYDIAMNSIDAV